MSCANNIFRRDIEASEKNQFRNLKNVSFSNGVNPPTSDSVALRVGSHETVSPASLIPTLYIHAYINQLCHCCSPNQFLIRIMYYLSSHLKSHNLSLYMPLNVQRVCVQHT
jgi:hypothetical protein